MKRSSRVRAAATAAVSVLSLALITGCGGSSNGGGGAEGADSAGAAGSSASGRPAGAAKALGAAELKKLIIAPGDVAGYRVAAAKGGPSRSAVKADNDKCLPLLYVLSGLAPGDAAAETARTATEKPKPSAAASTSVDDASGQDVEDALTDSFSLTVTTVALSSYDGDGAEKVMGSVSDAVAACAGGFTATADGEKQKFTEVSAEKPSGAGDASVAFAATGAMEDGDTAPLHGEVVRHGNTIASYYTINFGAMISKKAYDVPAAVLEAQSAKLK
ncbi:hypothetical protein ABZT03_24840 [Streptomyces sp. NPDC005574]|uniref:hypothetical protein n=1 Tax=Streptomyces sp. NPDC005574 TaxID=3156891 RepID=UPI0033ABC414